MLSQERQPRRLPRRLHAGRRPLRCRRAPGVGVQAPRPADAGAAAGALPRRQGGGRVGGRSMRGFGLRELLEVQVLQRCGQTVLRKRLGLGRLHAGLRPRPHGGRQERRQLDMPCPWTAHTRRMEVAHLILLLGDPALRLREGADAGAAVHRCRHLGMRGVHSLQHREGVPRLRPERPGGDGDLRAGARGPLQGLHRRQRRALHARVGRFERSRHLEDDGLDGEGGSGCGIAPAALEAALEAPQRREGIRGELRKAIHAGGADDVRCPRSDLRFGHFRLLRRGRRLCRRPSLARVGRRLVHGQVLGETRREAPE
mmetsp:Transcript_97575/g.280810  ORF Transcript_97575/g.280810 Transcript_97575/m.280810 type:complete len:314 (+) Transcript_97575:380-1321(+)